MLTTKDIKLNSIYEQINLIKRIEWKEKKIPQLCIINIIVCHLSTVVVTVCLVHGYSAWEIIFISKFEF